MASSVPSFCRFREAASTPEKRLNVRAYVQRRRQVRRRKSARVRVDCLARIQPPSPSYWRPRGKRDFGRSIRIGTREVSDSCAYDVTCQHQLVPGTDFARVLRWWSTWKYCISKLKIARSSLSVFHANPDLWNVGRTQTRGEPRGGQ